MRICDTETKYHIIIDLWKIFKVTDELKIEANGDDFTESIGKAFKKYEGDEPAAVFFKELLHGYMDYVDKVNGYVKPDEYD